MVPLSTEAASAYTEYAAMATREARFVKACDQLQLGVRLLAYENQGAAGLSEFWSALAPERFAEFAPCADFARTLAATRGGPA